MTGVDEADIDFDADVNGIDIDGNDEGDTSNGNMVSVNDVDNALVIDLNISVNVGKNGAISIGGTEVVPAATE